MDKQRILNIIKNRRKDLKFTQKDVADKLDIKRSQYNRYEIGKSGIALVVGCVRTADLKSNLKTLQTTSKKSLSNQ